jgi:hypothetical protein
MLNTIEIKSKVSPHINFHFNTILNFILERVIANHSYSWGSWTIEQTTFTVLCNVQLYTPVYLYTAYTKNGNYNMNLSMSYYTRLISADSCLAAAFLLSPGAGARCLRRVYLPCFPSTCIFAVANAAAQFSSVTIRPRHKAKRTAAWFDCTFMAWNVQDVSQNLRKYGT